MATPRPKNLAVELAQVESQARLMQYRLQNPTLSVEQHTTCGVIRDALLTRAEHLRDLIAWEKELVS